jgi:PPOX class probable F420-dependent enzyme
MERLPGWAKQLLAEARVARLALLDETDHPRVLPVTYALVGEALYSAIDDKPKGRPAADLARLRFLRRRPEAALLVDRYSDDWSALAWVQVLGRVEILEVDARPEASAALAAKYEPYRRRLPAGPLIELTPERALSWRADPH